MIVAATSTQFNPSPPPKRPHMGGPDMKVSTVDVESGDNMATLPVSRAHGSGTAGGSGGGGGGASELAEKTSAANKEMELKNVVPQPLQRWEGVFLWAKLGGDA